MTSSVPSPTGPTFRSTARSGCRRPSGCELALPSAKATKRFDPFYGAAAEVPVEVRGAGPSTRQLNNFVSPESFAGADRLMCVEVLTPDGNWSSLPAAQARRHRRVHRATTRRSTTSASAAPVGVATRQTASPCTARTPPTVPSTRTSSCATATCSSIPRGFHGPCIAAPGYPLYYLNVLAGPDPRTIDGVLRRPDPPMGTRVVERHAGRSPVPDDDAPPGAEKR